MEHYFSKLERAITSNWEKEALCDYHGESFSFEETATWIERFHLLFAEAGLRKGEKIALCAKNSARWAIAFLAADTYGCVVVPILSDFRPDNIAQLVRHSESRVLFTDIDIFNQLQLEELPDIRAIFRCSDFHPLYADDSFQKAIGQWATLYAHRHPLGLQKTDIIYNKDNDKELAVINYTSGTTSQPKGVMLRHECFSATIDFAIRNVACGPEDKLVSMLPMGHIYGLAFEFLFPLFHGVTVCFLGKTPSPSLLLKAMGEIKPFMVCTVPLVMEKIYKASVKPALDKPLVKFLVKLPWISTWIYRKIGLKIQEAFGGKCRHFIMGGAALNPLVEKAYKKMRLPFTVGYGMTEAAPLLAYAPWESFVPGSCGRAVDCAEVRVDSSDPEHIEGEIQARGTNICSGYFKNGEASAQLFTEDGFMRTGDLGIIDAKGNIFIRGRSKNMILSANGQNIYPEEIEALINAEDNILESLVLDREGKLTALVCVDFAALRQAGIGEDATADWSGKLRQRINHQLPSYSQLSAIELRDEPFEKTPKMSIRRFLYK